MAKSTKVLGGVSIMLGLLNGMVLIHDAWDGAWGRMHTGVLVVILGAIAFTLSVLRMRKRIMIGGVIIVIFGLSAFDVSTHGALRGFVTRAFLIPDIIAETEFTDLGNGNTRPNTIRREFYEQYRAKKGKYAVVSHGYTLEGYPVKTYYIVRDGRVTYVRDSTRNPYGLRKYEVEEADGFDLCLGYYSDRQFICIDPNDSVQDIRFHFTNKETIRQRDSKDGARVPEAGTM